MDSRELLAEKGITCAICANYRSHGYLIIVGFGNGFDLRAYGETERQCYEALLSELWVLEGDKNGR